MKRSITLLLLILLLSQCAARYKSIRPEEVEYDQVFEDENIRFSYRYDVLDYRHNKKLSRKEHHSDVRIIAAAITNKTTRTLNIDRDMDLFTDEEDPFYVDGKAAANRLKQNVNLYLFYCLAVYAKFDCTERGLNCKPTYFVPAGIAIAVYNMIVANHANKKMAKEFQKYSIYTRDIQPGETVYAILALEFEEPGNLPLQLSIKEYSKM